MSKKIFFYTDYYYPYIGGGEILWQNLAEGLVKKGVKVVFYTNRFRKDLACEEVLNGVKIYRNISLGGGILGRIIWIFASFWQGLKLVKKENPDIIHTTTYASALPAWLIAKILRKKVVLHAHEYIGQDVLKNEQNKIVALGTYFLEKMQIKLPWDRILTVSNFSAGRIAEVNKKAKIKVVYPGIDYKHWQPRVIDFSLKERLGVRKNEFLLMFFGRAGFSKGLEYLLSAFKNSHFAKPTKLVCFVGAQPPERFDYVINKFSFEKNDNQPREYCKDDIMIKPSLSYKDLPNYINLADAVVIPSLSEGFGFSAVESCVLGKSIVCSSKGSLPEVTFGQVRYFDPLVEEDFVYALEKTERGEFEKIDKKSFTWEECVEEMMKVYTSV